jgi:putative endonuclease
MPGAYILQSESTGKFCIGSAEDLPLRLAEHLHGHSPYTRNRGPWVLVYSEQHSSLADARHRERQIKSWKSHRSVEDLINQSGG